MAQTHTRLALFLSVSLAAPALAQTGPGMMLLPWEHEGNVDTIAQAFYTPTQADVTGSDVDLAIYDAIGRIRLHPESSYNPTIGFELVQYEIGSSDAALPDELTDVSVAFGGSFGEVDLGEALGEWQVGYTLGIGYAGTTPFEDSDAYYGKADLFGIHVIDQDTRWLVGINYDGNRTFLPDVPLPVVTYFARLNEDITYAIGLPYSRVTWTPTDRWTIDLRSALFISFNGKVTYKLTDNIDLFAAYVQRSDAFTASNGTNDRRFLFTQQRVELGVAAKLCSNAELIVAGGLAFGQEFDIGYDSRDPAGLRDLDDSGYVRAALQLHY